MCVEQVREVLHMRCLDVDSGTALLLLGFVMRGTGPVTSVSHVQLAMTFVTQRSKLSKLVVHSTHSHDYVYVCMGSVGGTPY